MYKKVVFGGCIINKNWKESIQVEWYLISVKHNFWNAENDYEIMKIIILQFPKNKGL